jgi:hypothetical protein
MKAKKLKSCLGKFPKTFVVIRDHDIMYLDDSSLNVSRTF